MKTLADLSLYLGSPKVPTQGLGYGIVEALEEQRQSTLTPNEKKLDKIDAKIQGLQVVKGYLEWMARVLVELEAQDREAS